MSKNKNTILILGIVGILIAGFGFPNSAEAANSSIYVSPASQNKEVGDIFDISIRVSPAGEKVCAVEGKLLLDKLDIQDIKMPIDEGISLKLPLLSVMAFIFCLGFKDVLPRTKLYLQPG